MTTLRNLDPALGFGFPAEMYHGVLVTLTLDGKNAQSLKFQYNPETITRTRSGQWEHKENKKSATPAQNKTQLDAQRGGGLYAKSETINIKLVFDVTEAILRGEPDRNGKMPEENGVLPEMAVLEGLAISKEQTGEDDKNKTSSSKLDSVAPQALLLILGGNRAFPVVVTSVNIVEQKFTPLLIPIRCECDIRFRVLESIENASNSVIADAYTALMKDRKTRSEEIYPFEAEMAEIIANCLRASVEG
jgi:hypothetical protein